MYCMRYNRLTLTKNLGFMPKAKKVPDSEGAITFKKVITLGYIRTFV